MKEYSRQDLSIRRIILVEGLANLAMLIAKVVVALSTGSLAVLGDAVHSLTDIANNLVAWFVVKISWQPADREHPYGHRKFETVAVFGLATLLAVTAFELALHAINREEVSTTRDPWSLALMLAVLGGNVALASWQRHWARRLKSDILLADANHTFADVLTTIVIIGGWQLSAMGYAWLDSLCALGVSALVMYLAYGLFRRAIPVLVDQFALPPELLAETTRTVPGVCEVRRIRSRSIGSMAAVDMIVTVDPDLSTTDVHAIADAIEHRLKDRHQVEDVSIHVEPDV